MSIAASIQETIGSAPVDLVSYFEQGDFPVRPSTNVNCLPFQQALEYTQAIHKASLYANPMGLFALDDAEDSNPYCYISRGPCAGAVMHLIHDDTSTIDFRSLDSFLTALRSLPLDTWIDELKPERPLLFDTAAEIERLMVEAASDFDVFAPVFLPVTRDLSEPLKQRLATHDDFFVREAFAGWLLSFGLIADEELASRLAADKVDQVARPAKKALERIKSL
jgi:hypothetical protein